MTTTSELPVVSVGPSCCPTGLGSAIDRETAEELARLMKAVADPARLQMLAWIRAQEKGESCVCDITDAVGLSQATVSHHLKKLVDAGILERSKRGYWTWYSVVPSRLEELAAVLA